MKASDRYLHDTILPVHQPMRTPSVLDAAAEGAVAGQSARLRRRAAGQPLPRGRRRRCDRAGPPCARSRHRLFRYRAALRQRPFRNRGSARRSAASHATSTSSHRRSEGLLVPDRAAPREQNGYVDVLPYRQRWDYSHSGHAALDRGQPAATWRFAARHRLHSRYRSRYAWRGIRAALRRGADGRGSRADANCASAA